MHTKRLFLLAGALCLLVLFLIAFLQSYERTEKKINVKVTETASFTKKITAVDFGGINIPITLATTQAEQNRGLSSHSSLPENEGMLFVFPYADTYGFWMKEMKFSIDIIWISENFEIVYIARDAKPESFPQVFKPSQKALYVLEVNSGFAAEHAIKEGDRATFITS